ncbi:hypothetical protein GCM10008090_32720 [Arenicella chitinivorans]|uniref:Uncharacterized protein n=1 Tax=Arenicella chitinivorans TaxID=1329800 RepID=A0A918VT30_9GAMM|nr:hypothetical protein [Arenicella chitinivorans]GHA20226.1 hypothetical protein GCM10008090_32720 [Arenicella chitinivorans]
MFDDRVLPVAHHAVVFSLFILLLPPVATAQADVQDLLDYWRLDEDSIFIQFVEAEQGLEASVIRSDWSPGLVGHTMFEALNYDADKKAWLGVANSLDNDGRIEVQLKLRRRNSEFKVREVSGPRLRMTWKLADDEEFN